MRVAYADPPYPGHAWRYRGEPTFAGEVNHAELIARLCSEFPDGWALSTSMRALRDVLALCPRDARPIPWCKPRRAGTKTRGLYVSHEYLIVRGGRQTGAPVADYLVALFAQKDGETLIGRKPIAFCAMLFDALGLAPGDELVDLFPGTGAVSRAWRARTVGKHAPRQATKGSCSARRKRCDVVRDETRPGVDGSRPGGRRAPARAAAGGSSGTARSRTSAPRGLERGELGTRPGAGEGTAGSTRAIAGGARGA